MSEKKRMPRDGFFNSTTNPFSIERRRVDSPWSMRGYHFHDSVEIYYLVSGTRYYFIKDKTFRVNAGEVVSVCPYDIHATAETEHSAYERILLMIKKEFISKEAQALGIDADAFFSLESRVVELSAKEKLRVQMLFETMLDEYEKSEQSEAVIRAALLGLILLLMKKQGRAEDTPSQMREGALLVSRVSGYIGDNFGQNLTLDALSARFFVRPSYLSRTFSRITGMTLTEHISAVRIKEAQNLLLSTELSVAAISERVGFSSATHFERVFKKITRMRPLEFKKSKKE